MGSGARTQLVSEVPCDSLAGGTGSGCAAECHFFGPGSCQAPRVIDRPGRLRAFVEPCINEDSLHHADDGPREDVRPLGSA